MKFSIFNAEKILCILHGQVFIMTCENITFQIYVIFDKKVQVGKDQEKAQS